MVFRSALPDDGGARRVHSDPEEAAPATSALARQAFQAAIGRRLPGHSSRLQGVAPTTIKEAPAVCCSSTLPGHAISRRVGANETRLAHQNSASSIKRALVRLAPLSSPTAAGGLCARKTPLASSDQAWEKDYSFTALSHCAAAFAAFQETAAVENTTRTVKR